MGLEQILSAVCVIAGILVLRPIVTVLPRLAGCLLRWKECINLENSVKLGRDRNIFAVFMLLPFCLAVSGYRLYMPGFLEGMRQDAYFGCVCAVFTGYLLMRTAAAAAVRKPKRGDKMWQAAVNSSSGFFCIMACLTLAAAGICSFSGISPETTRLVMLYAMLAVYLVSVFRKFQILRNCCSFLSSILYLCALEILPTAILILSAVFL